jgi:serine/threonine protein kinase
MLEDGQIIGNRYRLEELIGGGGMGSVWRATQIALQRPVAIKFLYSHGARPEVQAERFIREARIAASVVHRNVVDTLDFGVSDDGVHYMVMSLLQGETLARRLERDPPLSINELVRIISLSLRGLGAVHDAGIIHRDLKPENIFLVNDPEGAYPKLLDFGISRILVDGDDYRRSALTTKEGVMVGTPQYMSPEQVRGIKGLDRRTDIYSMGVILYEALTGRLPFDAEAIGDLMLLIVAGGAPNVLYLRPEVGSAMSQLVERAMARDRDLRFTTALEMQKALINASEESGVTEHYPILSVMPRPMRSNFPPPVKFIALNALSKDGGGASRLISEEISLTSLLGEQPKPPDPEAKTQDVSPSDYPTLNLGKGDAAPVDASNPSIAQQMSAYSSKLEQALARHSLKAREFSARLLVKVSGQFKTRLRMISLVSLGLVLLAGVFYSVSKSNSDPNRKPSGAAPPNEASGGRDKPIQGAPSAVQLQDGVINGSLQIVSDRLILKPSSGIGHSLILEPGLHSTLPRVDNRGVSDNHNQSVKREKSTRQTTKNRKKTSLILRQPDF